MSNDSKLGLLISLSSIVITLGILIAFFVSDIVGIIMFISGLASSSLCVEYY